MSKIAVLTDSNSGISQKEANDLGIFVIPMPFLIDGKEYYEDINLNQSQFFELLKKDVDIKTSQPSIASIKEKWDELLKEYDEIIFIPMSSSLSSTCDSCIMLADELEYYNKVFVVDNQRISVTQKKSCLEAKYLAEKNKSAKEIVDYLLNSKKNSSIYIMVDTLKYLKKGGRVTPSAAAIGEFLNVKPVLQIQGGKLDSYAKVLSVKLARFKMIRAIEKDLESRFKDFYQKGLISLYVAYTYNKEQALDFKKQVESEFDKLKVEVVDALSLSISCHIGPNALALACSVDATKQK